MDTATAPEPVAGWEETRTPHFVLYAGVGSYAARLVYEIAERAEAAYQHGSEWIGGDTSPPTITAYLADWLDEVPQPGWVRSGSTLVATDSHAICLLVSPA